jgi:ABC-2 type transport system ATP-binding protein
VAVVETNNLCKTFYSTVKKPGLLGSFGSIIKPEKKAFKAVDHVSFKIEEGEMVGFLGPNGAGKTTTLKMLTGILHATSGEAKVLGRDPFRREPELLRKISLVMGNKQQLWWDLPAWDSFVVLRELYGVSDERFKLITEELIPALNLEEKLQTQVRKLSLGERMKCELVAALIHSPRVIFLDEPTIGLDIVSQHRIRDFLKMYQKREGCTVILTSHYMQDVAELCKRVILVNEGKVVFDGSIESLTDKYSQERRLRLHFSTPVEAASMEKFGVLKEHQESEALIIIQKKDIAAATASLLQQLPVVDITVEEASIEEVISNLFTSPVSRETSAVD